MKGATPPGPRVLITINETAKHVAWSGTGSLWNPRNATPIAPGRTNWPRMPTRIAATTDPVTSGDGSPHAVKRRVITSPARDNESERKKIHAKQTTLKVRTRPNHCAACDVGRQPVA